MLCGEYDILNIGGKAIAIALNSYLQVILTTVQHSTQITVVSDYWQHERIITADSADNELLAILVKELLLPLNQVATVEVASQYLPSYGFGSSSALILALQTAKACITSACERDDLDIAEQNTIIGQAHSLQRRFQGQASGYDIITQWHGGLVKLQTTAAGQLQHQSELLHVYVGGKGASTPETLTTTNSWIQAEGLQASVRAHTCNLVASFLSLLQRNDNAKLSALVAAVAAWRQVFAASPCFPTHIAAMLTDLPDCDKDWTFKTSGAGGEDALLLIGNPQSLRPAANLLRLHGWQAISYQVDMKGLAVEW